MPSAFQIRIGGCKGVVSVWGDEFVRQHGSRFGSGHQLVVRNSMWKYPSEDRRIDVLEHTRPLALHLNQQARHSSWPRPRSL